MGQSIYFWHKTITKLIKQTAPHVMQIFKILHNIINKLQFISLLIIIYYNTFLKIVPGAQPASYTKGTRSLPGVKWPGRGVNDPPQSSAEVEKRV